MARSTGVTAAPAVTERWRLTLDDYVAALAWSPDGARLVAGSLAGDGIVVSALDGNRLNDLEPHPMGVLSATWSPDGRRLATGGQDGVVALYDAEGTRCGAEPCGGWVAALAWKPDSTVLAAAAGRHVRLLEPDGTVVMTSQPAASTVTSLAWAPDKHRLAAGCYGGVDWYGRSARPMEHFAWKGSILALAVSPDGRWLTAGAQDMSVHIWKLWSGDELEMSGYPTKVEHLAWHHSSRWLAVGNLGEITIWDCAGKGPSGRKPRQIDAHGRHIAALGFQPAGDLLASGGADGQVKVWDVSTKGDEPVAVVDADAAVSALAWSPGGRHLLVGTADGTVLGLEVADVR